MSKRIFLHLLILCCILLQEIIASSDEDTGESSENLVRKKRVITHCPGAGTPTPFEMAKYVVNIKRNDRVHCVGSILSHKTVISAARCFSSNPLPHFKILSGSAYDYNSNAHNVTSKVENFGNPPHGLFDGIALVTVDPVFTFGRTTGFIPLYEGHLLAGTPVTVRGWGINYPLRPAPAGTRHRLRAITLPIMNHAECQNVCRIDYPITDKHICTYEENQYCSRTDLGAALTFEYKLVGIHVWKGERMSAINPDVYIDLQNPQYRTWLRENIHYQ